MNNFSESPSTAVFTTRFVIENQSTILFVYHDDDGSWQFHGNDDSAEDDIRIVGLGEILDLDETVGEVGNIDVGFEAIRSSRNSSWKVVSSN